MPDALDAREIQTVKSLSHLVSNLVLNPFNT